MPQHVRKVLNRQTALAAVSATLFLACGGGKDAPRTPLAELAAQQAAGAPSTGTAADAGPPMPRDALIALDSGNALYRKKNYADALVQYRLAVKRAPDDGTGYFGIYMVADVTKNRPLLDSAVAALKAHGMVAPVGMHK